jgi:RNA recognition motif-containing protein
MVSSSAITGALIDFRLFDQSIVGIFPKPEQQNLLMYLLGFFNSKVCNNLIRTINASTNNSSNYIKKLPIIIPPANKLDLVSGIVKALYEKSKLSEITESDLEELNSQYFEIFGVENA